MAPKIISDQQSAFLRFEIEKGTAQRRKIALQTLSYLYRTNNILKGEQRQSIETTINGIVLVAQDVKVVRWCLNSLAYVGKRGSADTYVSSALRLYEGNPEITAAGIAALSKMYGEKIGEVAEFKNFDPTLRILAAMQHTPARYLDVAQIKIDIDKSTPDILKLALITVGLRREIENLFHPRHSNGEIVKALGQYPDKIVVQYSVWAIIENVRLKLSDLGVKLDDFDNLSPNVQSKLLQLIVEREIDARKKHEFIVDVPYNANWESREGLARTLRRHYYDGLETITLDWYEQEKAEDVQAHLAEHFARFSEYCSPYLRKAEEIIEAEPRLKGRILLGAEGKPLYRLIKEKDAHDGHPDFFGSRISELETKIQNIAGAGTTKRPQLKVVYLAASPVNEGPLRVDQEARDIRDNLRNVDDPKIGVAIANEWAVQVSKLQDIILNERPKILHFSGHGGGGSICFEDKNGNAADVDGVSFAELIKLAGNNIECAVLNACHSSDLAKHIKPPVQCVIGCDGSISDKAAVAYSRAFYNALARGKSYKDSFDLGQHAVKMEFGRSQAKKYQFHKL